MRDSSLSWSVRRFRPFAALTAALITSAVIAGDALGACPDFSATRTYPAQPGPDSFAAADFDEDGKRDLAVTNENWPTLSILHGGGDGTFTPDAEIQVGFRAMAVLTADFNGDGHADLALARAGTLPAVLILDGNGDGTFAPSVSYPAGSAPRALSRGDFNRDGFVDLAVANQASNNVSILFGNGAGTFLDPVNYPVGSAPNSIVAMDYDVDGKLDLAVANYASGNVSILKGNADGTFAAAVNFSTGAGSWSVAFGDFNGDDRLDLAVTNVIDATLSILFGNWSTFAPPVNYPGYVSGDVATSDFDRDGAKDLAVSLASGLVEILRGNGDGTFAVSATYPVGAIARPVLIDDFNDDGQPDLVAGQYYDGRTRIAVLVGKGDGTFAGAPTYAPASLVAISVADFNGDGINDFAVANSSSGISVVPGAGGGKPGVPVGYASGAGPRAIATADLNGDGAVDIVVADGVSGGSNDLAVLLGNGDGTFAAAVPYALGHEPRAIVLADFNADQHLDIAVATNATTTDVLLGAGDGTFGTATGYAAGSAARSLVAADFNGDGNADLASANYGSQDISILMGQGNGTFVAGTTVTLGFPLTALAARDFNEDNKQDLIAGGDWNGAMLQGNGDGTFATPTPASFAAFSHGMVATDFNADGHADLASANAYTAEIAVLLGAGDGSFSSIATLPMVGPNGIAAADLDGGGTIDIAVASDAGISVSLASTAPHIYSRDNLASGASSTASTPQHPGSSYQWTVVGGSITAGQGTSRIQYTAGPAGTRISLSVVEVNGVLCTSDPATAHVMVDFLDVPPSHPFHDFIVTIARNGITGGCGGGNYCPAASVLRSQMAVFLLRGEHGEAYAPPAATGFFADVTVPSFFADFIEQLYNEGITGGCASAPLRYCPNDSVRRWQMAVFLLRAEHGSAYVPPPSTGIFSDVPAGSIEADFMEQLYREGITGGCSAYPLRYCPNAATNRAAMAVFLTRTFGLQ